MEKELGAARINVQFATLSLAEIEDFLRQFEEYGNAEIISMKTGPPVDTVYDQFEGSAN